MAKLRGGVHLEDNKLADQNNIIVPPLSEGDEFLVSFVQHVGSPAVAAVSKGDEVMPGTILAAVGAGLSVPVHSPVHAKVTALTKVFHPMYGVVDGCVLSVLSPSVDFIKLPQYDNITDCVKSAGIVGLGGAGFPCYAKISSSVGRIDTILINAAECEPYLTCDHALMIHKYKEILEGVKILKTELKASAAIIAIEDNKHDAQELLSKHARQYGVDIVVMRTKYPQGGEKQLIKTVLNRTVPAGKLPADAGVLVHNVATVFAIYEAFVSGKPLYERIITISGDTANHCNVYSKIGTPVSRLLRVTNNENQVSKRIIFGGPMTGSAIADLNAPTLKTTGGILLMEHEPQRKAMKCIRCGKCAEVCVMGLVPTDLEHCYALRDIDGMRKNDIMSCIECGCCSYSCPSGRFLSESIKAGKRMTAAKAVKGGVK